MSASAPDICFTGASMLPGFLAFAEQPELAMAAFLVLVLAGSVFAIADPGSPHREWERRERSTTTRQQ